MYHCLLEIWYQLNSECKAVNSRRAALLPACTYPKASLRILSDIIYLITLNLCLKFYIKRITVKNAKINRPLSKLVDVVQNYKC
ncbi:hypothetical protein OTSUT76_1404 [Orientia tsutsugamushi str. UT76]|nr:hypothetical protein OTSUT76_1404 [Orientia tsutsugamushi str. UT76]